MHSSAVLPLLRHGDGHAGMRVQRRDDGGAGRRFRAGRDLARGDRRKMHGALRRADHVRRHARPPGLQELRFLHAAHRHHGRRALPHRGDEEGQRADEHAGGDHRLRHDRDQPGLVPERRRRLAGETRVQRRSHPAASGGEADRRERQDRPGRPAGRALHPRLFGDEGLLGRRGEDQRRHRRRRLDAHRRSRRRSTRTATATSSAG